MSRRTVRGPWGKPARGGGVPARPGSSRRDGSPTPGRGRSRPRPSGAWIALSSRSRELVLRIMARRVFSNVHRRPRCATCYRPGRRGALAWVVAVAGCGQDLHDQGPPERVASGGQRPEAGANRSHPAGKSAKKCRARSGIAVKRFRRVGVLAGSATNPSTPAVRHEHVAKAAVVADTRGRLVLDARRSTSVFAIER
jgi:hypothetical protein